MQPLNFFIMKKTAKKIVSLISLCLIFNFWYVPKNVEAKNTGVIVQLKEGRVIPEEILRHSQRLFVNSSSLEFKDFYKIDDQGSEWVNSHSSYFNFIDTDKPTKTETVYLNDPGFTTNPGDTEKQWALARANFIEAWDKSTGSSKTIIAVVDTGIDVTHADLQTITFTNGYNFLNNKTFTSEENSDDNGHGTMIAGIIGASPNNASGIVGANWQVGIMPLKALDSAGSGVSSHVSEAIVYAADNGAHIINLSLGGSGFSGDRLLERAIEYAFNKGLVIVSAAGNDSVKDGLNLDVSPTYPVCNDNDVNMVIGVTAVDNTDIKPAFSNYGKNCIDVAAPGKRILSTINRDPISGKAEPNSYAFASGTSLAVPYVSAEAALLKAMHPTASNRQIRDVILKAVDKVDFFNRTQCGGGSCVGVMGTGRINAYKAVIEPIVPPQAKDGDLVKDSESGIMYYINGGKKQRVSEFVRIQRFAEKTLETVPPISISSIPEGSYALPEDGTLVKSDISPTVYFIRQGMKLPVTAEVFKLKEFNQQSVNTLNNMEVSTWLTGKFLAPPEGALVRGIVSPAVYWVVNGEIHPINKAFYDIRGLSFFPISLVPDLDINSYQIGSPYVL